MKKKTLLGLLLMIAAGVAMAQGNDPDRQRRGFGLYLGADRDTLQYIVASPFDNWYFEAGVGAQTYIGNEFEDSARWNPMDYHLYFELGKWVIPDVAVGLNFAFWNMHGQTRYAPHPFVDFSGVPIHPLTTPLATNYYEYRDFTAHGISLTGLVYLEWTNFLNGYEKGSAKKFHVMTPIGLGFSMLYGDQRNPGRNYPVGSFRRNFELHAKVGVLGEYNISEKLALNARADLAIARQSLDWSPNVATREEQSSIFDMMPSLTVGVRMNFIKKVTKVDARTGKAISVNVNHVFLPASNERINYLENRIDTLRGQVQDLTKAEDQNASAIRELNRKLDSLQNQLKNNPSDQSALMPQIQNVQFELARLNDLDNTDGANLTPEQAADLVARQKARQDSIAAIDKRLKDLNKMLDRGKGNPQEIEDEIANLIERRGTIGTEALEDNHNNGVKDGGDSYSPLQAAQAAAARAMRLNSLDELNHQLDSLQRLLVDEIEVSDPMTELSAAIERLGLPMCRVYYQLDKFDLDYNARKVLHEFALKVKKGPTDVKYFIIGAADAQTGSVPHNKWLSNNRCQAVYDVLTRSYGIPESQLEMYPLGGITEYTPQENNRTAIVVLSNSELTQIIDKWTKKK